MSLLQIVKHNDTYFPLEADEELLYEIVTGVAILGFGFLVLLGLALYVWLVLWKVGPEMRFLEDDERLNKTDDDAKRTDILLNNV